MQNLQEAQYRIEERTLSGSVVAAAGLDDRDRAMQCYDGWRRYLTAVAAAHGEFSPVRPHGNRRLVLIDRETHIIAPQPVVEGPAL